MFSLPDDLESLSMSPLLCHSCVTVARRNGHDLATMQPAKILFSRVKTVLDSVWQQFEPEFVMRRSGVRFISPAPLDIGFAT